MLKIKRVLHRIIYPGGFWPILIALIGIGLLVFVFFTGGQDEIYANYCYPITLYAMIVLVLGFSDIITTTKALVSKNKYGNIYINDSKLRATISLYQGLFVNLFFVVFYAFTSWRSASPWFGAVAGYYVVLSTIRFILLRSVRKTSKKENKSERYIHELKTYRACGYLMITLNLVMSGMIFQMIWQNKGYEYSGMTIFVSATYAFYSMVMAIISMVNSHKLDSPVLSAAKMLSFAGALMSMLALQTAMITQFGADQESFKQIMNAASGGSVFVTVLFMDIYMVVRGNKELKKAQINNS